MVNLTNGLNGINGLSELAQKLKPSHGNMKAQALLEQMSIEEKISLLSGADHWHSQSIERLGIPRVRTSDGPVSFFFLRQHITEAMLLSQNGVRGTICKVVCAQNREYSEE